MEFNYKIAAERHPEHVQIFENQSDAFLNNPWVKEKNKGKLENILI